MKLKQNVSSTAGVMQYPSFADADWASADPYQYTTTAAFRGTLKGAEGAIKKIAGSTDFTLTGRPVGDGGKLQYSLGAFSKIYQDPIPEFGLKGSNVVAPMKTAFAKMLTDVVKIDKNDVNKNSYRIQLGDKSMGPGSPFISSLLTNISFTARLEREEGKLSTLFLDLGKTLVPSVPTKL